MYKIVFTKQAEKDIKLLKSANLENKAKTLLNFIAENPFGYPPSYEKLIGNLKGYYSRRINLHHRLVYKVVENEKTIVIMRMFTHYHNF